jgi:hypothetical protein
VHHNGENRKKLMKLSIQSTGNSEPLTLRRRKVKTASVFLAEQWPPQPAIRMSKQEQLEMLSEALKKVKQPDDIDIEEIQR